MVSSTRSKDVAIKNFIKNEVNNNEVVVFSKSYCLYSMETKRTLSKLNIKAKVHQLNKMDDGAGVQQVLLQMTGQRTVPNVWVKGQHVGGNNDTRAIAALGELQKVISA